MNFGTPVPLLVGLILILGAVGLFFLDKLKPGYERSSDKVYSILLLLSGIFLLAHLNMELLASFQQVMLVGMLTTLIINDISKRDSNRNSARSIEREGPPRRYDERPRRVYRAELDDWDAPPGPSQQRIPSDRYRDSYGDDRYEPRPLEPRRPPYEDRRPPARLQPGQQDGRHNGADRPNERFDNYADSRPGRPDDRPMGANGVYSNPRYDGGGAPPPNNRPQRPPQPPLDRPVPSGSGAGHSLGGVSQAPPIRNDRPPLDVRPRPNGPNQDSYTDFRPAPTTDGDAEPSGDAPPPQPPVNY